MNPVMLSMVASASLFAGAAHATVTVFTDRTAWDAAAGTIVATEDFTDGTFVNGLTISQGGLSGGQWLDVVNPANPGTDYSFDAVAALGFDLDMTPGGFGSGHIYTLPFVGGGTEVLPGLNAYAGFYGIVSSTPFTKLTIAGGTGPGVETYVLDNMGFGVIPEAGTWAMMIAGFGLVGAGLRRRREAFAA